MRVKVLILIAALACVVLAGCKPMENKELENKNRDDSGKAMKKAGVDDSTP